MVRDDRDRHSYLSRFLGTAQACQWTIHASSLLDTHHHSVLETPAPDLSDGMRRILGGYAAWFNARHGRTGAVFAERFWSVRVYDDAHLLRACLYTLLNPIAAGLAEHPRDWVWSSYRAMLEQGCSARLHAILDARQFLALLDEGVERIRATAPDRSTTLRLADELGRRAMQGRG